ncbi:MAG: DUF3253 domain-containing protein [Erythrobacter sp.]|uniref:DUF3253 domain-containing protein n=1 Tax=Qipengyuania citrea TaxID=225971 RepID=UPI001A3EC120|nr:DUF3253 domain-containing protein [Erythrobacter sp.]MCP2018912.1 hypothetical protein [Qipengyuania citrea]MDE0902253.1 DUF3253 domain-containing protein [Erythrobacter sp.]
MTVGVANAAVLTLLAERAPETTICPSEVARKITCNDAADWRLAMPLVREAVDQLFDQKIIRLSWKGRLLSARSGSYRIGRAADSQ